MDNFSSLLPDQHVFHVKVLSIIYNIYY